MKWGKAYNENPTLGPGDKSKLCDTCLQYYFTDWKCTILYYYYCSALRHIHSLRHTHNLRHIHSLNDQANNCLTHFCKHSN